MTPQTPDSTRQGERNERILKVLLAAHLLVGLGVAAQFIVNGYDIVASIVAGLFPCVILFAAIVRVLDVLGIIVQVNATASREEFR